MRIGICDDERETCAELREMLQALRTGDKIDVYADVFDLLTAIREGTAFDLLFLDICLPDLKGTALTHKIRKQHPMPLPALVFVTTAPTCGRYDRRTRTIFFPE